MPFSTVIRRLALLAVLCPLVARAAAPVNDKFASAINLPARYVTLANQNATLATAEALDPYLKDATNVLTKVTKSVWYRFDVAFNEDRTHVVLTHTAAARFGVFYQTVADGNEGTLQLAAGNPQAASAFSGTDTVTFTPYAAVRYYICVEAPTGTFSLTLKQAGPGNDYFEDAANVAGLAGTYSSDVTNASNDGDLPPVALGVDLRHGVWYKWTPGINAPVVVDTAFSQYAPGGTYNTISTALCVFTGSALSNLALVTSTSTGGLNGAARTSFIATAGVSYYILVGTNGNAAPGYLDVQFFAASNPGIFEFGYYNSNPTENQGPTAVEVRRRYAGTVAVNVNAATANGTATANSDYTPVSTTLNFPAGGASSAAYLQIVNINTLADTVAEGSETFSFTLSGATGGATISGSSILLFIGGPETGVAPGFLTPTMQVKESDGVVYVPVSRVNNQASSFIYLVPNYDNTDTASYPADYSIVGNYLNMAAGQSMSYLPVYLANNARPDGDRKLTLTVLPSDVDQRVEGYDSLTITIADDEAPQPAAGRLSAHLYGGYQAPGGVVNATIAAGGAITGKVLCGRGALPFTGKLSATGAFVAHYSTNRTLKIQLLSSTASTYQVSLENNDEGGVISTTVTASSYSAAYPCPGAGLYTVADSGSFPVAQTLGASVKVDALGNAIFTGKLFDGTVLAASGYVDPAGNAVVGAALYANQGCFGADFALPQFAGLSTSASFDLTRPARGNQTVELPLVIASFDGVVARYTPPATGTRLLSIWDPAGNGTAALTSGGYAGTVMQTFNVSTANVLTLTGVPNVPTLKITFTPATGVFTGTVMAPGAAVVSPVYGVVLQQGSSSIGNGFFVNPTQLGNPGRVRLH